MTIPSPDLVVAFQLQTLHITAAEHQHAALAHLSVLSQKAAMIIAQHMVMAHTSALCAF